ncbi:MAG: hypothetical protein IKD04_01955 [Clostridia bacterium]|nr:hypothetical protein [Clostridia bacterium]
MASNFDFIKAYDENFPTEKLYEFECKLQISMKSAGASMREFLDEFYQYCLEKLGLWDDYNTYLAENGREDNLGNGLFFLTKNRYITDYPISTEYKKGGVFKTRFAEGYKFDKEKLYVLFYLRSFGNKFHHGKKLIKKENDPEYVIDYFHILDCAFQLHKYICKFLGASGIPYFNIEKAPIENKDAEYRFEIIRKKPVMYSRNFTNCRFEYEAMYYRSTNSPRYAILQFFPKDDGMSRTAQKRSTTAYNENDSIIFGRGIKDIFTVAGTESDSEYYILAHIFAKEPKPLTEELLKKMSVSERLDVALRIAEIIRELHNGDEVRIYHRLLNYGCIYLCENHAGARWYPAITNFFFAKMDTADQDTSLDREQKKKILSVKDRTVSKYIPIEWFNVASEQGAPIDIYSLGMLFFDILCARFCDFIVIDSKSIGDYFPRMKNELISAGIADTRLHKLIFDMLSLSMRRPDAATVCQRLREIINS